MAEENRRAHAKMHRAAVTMEVRAGSSVSARVRVRERARIAPNLNPCTASSHDHGPDPEPSPILKGLAGLLGDLMTQYRANPPSEHQLMVCS